MNQSFTSTGWHHFAAVFNDDQNYCKFYVDGAEVASVSTTVTNSLYRLGHKDRRWSSRKRRHDVGLDGPSRRRAHLQSRPVPNGSSSSPQRRQSVRRRADHQVGRDSVTQNCRFACCRQLPQSSKHLAIAATEPVAGDPSEAISHPAVEITPLLRYHRARLRRACSCSPNRNRESPTMCSFIWSIIQSRLSGLHRRLHSSRVSGATHSRKRHRARWESSSGSIARLTISCREDAEMEIIGEGFQWSEGPVWIRDGGFLLFSDVLTNTIHRWDRKSGCTVYHSLRLHRQQAARRRDGLQRPDCRPQRPADSLSARRPSRRPARFAMRQPRQPKYRHDRRPLRRQALQQPERCGRPFQRRDLFHRSAVRPGKEMDDPAKELRISKASIASRPMAK